MTEVEVHQPQGVVSFAEPQNGTDLAAWVADLGDAVSITRGIREGRLARLPALGASSGAAAAVVAGVVFGGRELLAAARLARGQSTYAPR